VALNRSAPSTAGLACAAEERLPVPAPSAAPAPTTTPTATAENEPDNQKEQERADRGVDDRRDDADAEMDAELIEGLSFPVYRRVSTTMMVAAENRPSSVEMLTIDPRDLEAAQERDSAADQSFVSKTKA
jgi:hypothetical protein